MRHWRAILRVASPLATPLTAERLFGHVCWGMAWREGPEAVADFLARMGSENPPLVIGAPMPVGFAPMPIVLRTGQVAVDVRGRHAAMWERYRRRGIMPRAALVVAARDLGNPEAVIAALDASGWHGPVVAKRQVRVRSAANRLSGGPLGGGDWLAVETWGDSADKGARDGSGESLAGQVEVVIVSDLEAARIEQLLRDGLENGFGRAASVGYGQVEVVRVEVIEDWPAVDGADALVTWGACVPRREDPAGGWWRIGTRWGRLGGGFSSQTAAVEKRPVMVLEAGAVLKAAGGERQEKSREYVGRLVAGVHPERTEVVHYGLAPVVTVRVGNG